MYESEHKRVITQLERTVGIIAENDYPSKWPGLLNDINQALTSGNEKGIYVGLVSLQALVKSFEYEVGSRR